MRGVGMWGVGAWAFGLAGVAAVVAIPIDRTTLGASVNVFGLPSTSWTGSDSAGLAGVGAAALSQPRTRGMAAAATPTTATARQLSSTARTR